MQEPATCGAGTQDMEVPALQFPYRLPCRNRQRAAQEPKTWKFLRCRFTIKYCAGTGNVRRRNPRQLQNGEFEISCFFFTSGAVIPILQTGCVIIIAIDIDVHAIENHFKIWHELSSHRWVIFVCFFCVMGLEADTVCINNATHPSRPG